MTEHEHPFQADTDRQDAARYRQARDLCGGEDPVEALKRISETVQYDAALSGPDSRIPETLSGWVISGHQDAERLRRAMGESVIHVITQRDDLLDLVQRLLDHSPGGRHPYFLIGTKKLPKVLLPDGRWDPLREEARSKVAEIGKTDPDRCPVCGTERIGPHEGDKWCPSCPDQTKET